MRLQPVDGVRRRCRVQDGDGGEADVPAGRRGGGGGRGGGAVQDIEAVHELKFLESLSFLAIRQIEKGRN